MPSYGQQEADESRSRSKKYGKGDSTDASGALQSAAQEASIQNKADKGVTITNDDLGYMGHMANDRVMKYGHNTGNNPKGKAAVTGIARKGYRVLPGTAVHQIGQARFGEAATDLPPPRHVREAQAKADKAFKRSLAKGRNETPFAMVQPVVVKPKGKKK